MILAFFFHVKLIGKDYHDSKVY